MLRRMVMTVGTCCAVAALLGAAPTVIRAETGHLTVVQEDPDPVPAGGQTVLHPTVANGGPGAAGEFTLTVSLPDGASAPPKDSVPPGSYFPKSCEPAPDGRTVSCTFRAGLPTEQTASARVPLQISPDASGVLTGGQVSVSSPADQDQSGHTDGFQIQIDG
ncbi:hypothetical protein OG455_02910 [Kitasatospora sp. NBC_01287]|uniref:hypothetical protein n=1 Tax=Kitasatospora sp. NBC_01287 TaxID=2903573 RepID=UPI00224D1B4B|nr:hypothetical protein [Kitasatospora sp. NBC_01287]MCX4744478.1 hypothetical protein [Kitasatospora sp. NBC_01287]